MRRILVGHSPVNDRARTFFITLPRKGHEERSIDFRAMNLAPPIEYGLFAAGISVATIANDATGEKRRAAEPGRPAPRTGRSPAACAGPAERAGCDLDGASQSVLCSVQNGREGHRCSPLASSTCNRTLPASRAWSGSRAAVLPLSITRRGARSGCEASWWRRAPDNSPSGNVGVFRGLLPIAPLPGSKIGSTIRRPEGAVLELKSIPPSALGASRGANRP